jgi:hypothetical protein
MVEAAARGAWWRRLLLLLIVTSGAVLAWVSACRRPQRALPAHTWSDAVAPAAEPARMASGAVDEPSPTPRTAVTAPVDDPAPVQAQQAPVAEAPPKPASVAETAPVAEPEPAHLLSDAAPQPLDSSAPREPTPGPYPSSVLPLADGSPPSSEFTVKGKAGSMRCHATGSPYFGRTRAEVWFRSQEDAVAAGFRPWAPKR